MDERGHREHRRYRYVLTGNAAIPKTPSETGVFSLARHPQADRCDRCEQLLLLELIARFNITTMDSAGFFFLGCNSPAADVVVVDSGWLRLRWVMLHR